MGKKQQYVSSGYIEQVEHYLHNNLDIQELYLDSDKNLKLFEELLLEGEEYFRLKDNLDHYAITSFGRVFNIDRLKQLTIMVLNGEKIVIYLIKEKQDLEVIFEERAWNFDLDEIIKRYDKRGWYYKINNPRRGI